jgi:DNA polymerase (family 10)
VAVTDHTRAARIAGGLDARRMRRHLARIERLNERLRGITLLKSAEVEILADGSLDLPDDVLAQMDLTVCAVHFPHGLDARRQAERILRAMDHPAFTVLAHPTGRLLGQREPYPLDLERVVAGAAERGRWIELNAQPRRADLPEEWGRAAKEAGVLVALGTDAHAVDQLDLMRFGVGLARRRWLEAADVVNTRSLRDLRRLLRGR